MAKNKYTYYKVIQEMWCGKWNDSDFHETNSQFFSRTEEDHELFRYNLKAYRENAGCPIRVIKRREKTV